MHDLPNIVNEKPNTDNSKLKVDPRSKDHKLEMHSLTGSMIRLRNSFELHLKVKTAGIAVSQTLTLIAVTQTLTQVDIDSLGREWIMRIGDDAAPCQRAIVNLLRMEGVRKITKMSSTRRRHTRMTI